MFIPEQPNEAQQVPFFDDVTGEGGWQGHGTSKSIDTLKAEIISSIARLGGLVSGFQRGTFQISGQERDGFQIHYSIETPDGSMVPGRIDVAALPIKKVASRRKSEKTRREKSLRMALYMLRQAMDGLWFLQQLSPGYAPMMPWMIGKGGKTISQLWAESPVMSNLLPDPGEAFVEGEVCAR